jgi:hypothetical protein
MLVGVICTKTYGRRGLHALMAVKVGMCRACGRPAFAYLRCAHVAGPFERLHKPEPLQPRRHSSLPSVEEALLLHLVTCGVTRHSTIRLLNVAPLVTHTIGHKGSGNIVQHNKRQFNL